MTMLERVQSVEDNLTLNSNYEYELLELKAIESDIPVYRYMNVPVWKVQEARERITQIREWIKQEMEHRISE